MKNLLPTLPASGSTPRLAGALLSGLLVGATAAAAAAGTPSTPPASADAQINVNVTGTVRDAKGSPIPGASVVLKGTTTGTSTDAQGVFRMNLPTGNETLVVSSVGFVKQEVVVGGRSTVDVTLKEETSALNEVVVVGYGNQSRATLTGAVATVDMKAIEELPVGSLSTAIAGQNPGVGVSGGTARPGEKGAITIRRPLVLAKDGGTERPLFVIDNVVRTEEDFNLLDQSEVEAISILKDAAAAIYGARSNQGVVVVATKRGKAGPPKFSYSGSVGVADAVRLPSMMTGLEHATYLNDLNFYRQRPATDPSIYTPDELAYFAENNNNWLEQAWKPSTTTRNALNVSGGGERATYFASVTYNRQNGNFDNVKSDKWTFRASTDVNVAKGLKAGLSLSGDLFKRKTYWFKQGQESADNDARSLLLTPAFQAFYVDGVANYATPGVSSTNTLDATHFFEVQRSNNYTSQRNTGLNLTANIDYDLPFVKGLKARVLYSRTLDNNFGKNFGTSYQVTEFRGLGTNRHIPGGEVVQKRNVPNGNQVFIVPTYTDTYQLNGYLNYDQQFGRHQISALAFFEQQEQQYEEVRTSKSTIVPNGLDNMNFAIGEVNLSETARESGILSYAGRINYSFANKYLLELALRYDGSTNFAPEYRWGLFPSLSAGWVISEENFFFKSGAINFLKVRGSVGLLGGDATKAYNWQENYKFEFGKGAVFGGNSSDRTLTIAPNNALANRRARWDNNEKYNAGIDARFLDNRLSFTVDGFLDKRYNMLSQLSSSAPVVIGAALPSENYSAVNSFGTEVSVGYADKIGSDFTYRINSFFAWSDTRNVKVDVERGKRGQWDDPSGRSRDPGVTGYEYLGMFRTDEEVAAWLAMPENRNYTLFGDAPKAGMLYYRDIRGPKDASGNYTAPDGKITEDDQTYLTKKASNLYSVGLNPSFSYKGLSVQLTMGLSFGGMDMVESAARKVASSTSNRPAFWADHWTPATPDAKYPAPFTSNQYDRPSAFWFRSSTTATMRNATISYSLPTAWVNRASISSARIYFVAVNPINFYNPYDYKTYGGSFDVYPTLRTLSLGLNVGF